MKDLCFVTKGITKVKKFKSVGYTCRWKQRMMLIYGICFIQLICSGTAVASATLAELCLVSGYLSYSVSGYKIKHYGNVDVDSIQIYNYELNLCCIIICWVQINVASSKVAELSYNCKFITVNKVLCTKAMRLSFYRTMNLRVCGSGIVL